MKNNKSAIAISETIRIIQMIIGIPVALIGIVFSLFAFADFFDPAEDTGLMVGLFIFFGLIAALGIWIIVCSITRKRRLIEFKRYVGIISASRSGKFELIAKETKEPVEIVQKKLEWMIHKRFFNNVRMNLVDDCIDIAGITDNEGNASGKMKYKTVVCKSCSATNIVETGKITECPYCSTPLQG